jgi:aryl-alcohol dehydrogenase-like predicted oxidoreductase
VKSRKNPPHESENRPSNTRKSSAIDRRQFGRLAAAGAVAMAGVRPLEAADPGEAAPTEGPFLPGTQRKKVGEVYHRPFGRTGIWVSELALGGSPSPPENIFRAALERGINYCDSSPGYGEGRGEEGIGRAIRGRRDQIYVGTKFRPNREGITSTEAMIRQVEGSLKRLGTDYIDILCAHRAVNEEDLFSDWVLAGVEQLRRDGKARFFGASVHNSSLEFNQRLIESEHYQVLLMPLNMYFDSREGDKGPDTLRQILDLAAKNGVAVVGMKSLAAGGLAKVEAARAGISAPQAKLRWVLGWPQVATVLNEMTTFAYLKENIAACTADLSAKEAAWLRDNFRRTASRYCRMCQTCEEECPQRLPLADLFRARMYAVDYCDRSLARGVIAEIDASRRLAACDDCGRCEEVCPWGVKTRALLRDVKRMI